MDSKLKPLVIDASIPATSALTPMNPLQAEVIPVITPPLMSKSPAKKQRSEDIPTLQNDPKLTSDASKFNMQLPPTNAPPSNPNTIFSQRVDLTCSIRVSRRTDFIINVQNDFRLIVAYLVDCVCELCPTIEVASHPYVSPFSIVAYCLTIFAGISCVIDTSVRSK